MATHNNELKIMMQAVEYQAQLTNGKLTTWSMQIIYNV
jgi:hypothetical protein